VSPRSKEDRLNALTERFTRAALGEQCVDVLAATVSLAVIAARGLGMPAEQLATLVRDRYAAHAAVERPHTPPPAVPS
jgi:hypothetical protein